MTCLAVEIYGMVQGVFFRKSTANMANELGLSGFVMNRPDGSVYAEVCGEEAAVNKLVDYCHVGPPAANVSRVITSRITTQHTGPFVEKRY
jgi:acylphosphatase